MYQMTEEEQQAAYEADHQRRMDNARARGETLKAQAESWAEAAREDERQRGEYEMES